LEFRCYLS